ncbi:GIY-YIG nuclease family protein [Leucobacter chromiiresistens]
MSGFEVEKLPFALDAVQAWGEADPRHHNWPVVYVLNNDRDVYVGESLNAHGRMRQHLDSAEKRGLEWVRVVLDDTFNKSACLDLESFLIRMFSGEGRLPRRAHGGHLPRSRAPCNCDPPTLAMSSANTSSTQKRTTNEKHPNPHSVGLVVHDVLGHHLVGLTGFEPATP